MKELEDNMMMKFECRFPFSDEAILASLLDPRFQNLLDVHNYLKRSGYTAVEFIANCAENNIKDHHHVVQTIDKGDKSHTSAPEQLPKKSHINGLVEKHSTLASIARSCSSSEQTNLQRECFLLLSIEGVSDVSNI